ncbi:MAG: hypothetical protein JOZ48_15485 [Acidobacteriaceae bacterium]|nr:hypothetical protein [Acidobacteriaceae bacterium]
MTYAICYFVVPILGYVDENWIAISAQYQRDVIPVVVLVSAFAFLAFLLGYASNTWRSPWIKKAAKTKIREDRLLPAWLWTTGGALVIWVWLVWTLGWTEIFEHREVAFEYKGMLLYSYLGLCAYSAVLSLLIYKIRGSKSILFIEAALLVVLGFGGRGQLVDYSLAVCLLASPEVIRKLWSPAHSSIFRYWPIVLILSAGIGLVFLRSNQTASSSNVKTAIKDTFGDGEMFALVYNFYSGHLLNGRTIWEIRYIFMPRQFFPDKPVIYGNGVFEDDLAFDKIYGSESLASSTFGILAELYANFGHIGLFAGMLAWGWAYAFLENFRRTPLRSFAFFIYLVVFMDQFWSFRHGLLGLVQIFTVPVLMCPIFFKVLYGRPRQRFRRYLPRPAFSEIPVNTR